MVRVHVQEQPPTLLDAATEYRPAHEAVGNLGSSKTHAEPMLSIDYGRHLSMAVESQKAGVGFVESLGIIAAAVSLESKTLCSAILETSVADCAGSPVIVE